MHNNFLIVVALRVFGAVSAFACFYIACLLYEDQERRVQEKLAEVWIWIEDDRSDPSYINRYIRACARLADEALTWIFGERLVTPRSIGVALSYSVASYLLVMYLPKCSFAMVTWIAGCFASGTLAATFPNRYTALIASFVPIIYLVLQVGSLFGLPLDITHRAASGASLSLAFAVALGQDFWWLKLNREFMKVAIQTHWTVSMIMGMIVSTVIFISAFLPFARDPFPYYVYNSNVLYNLFLIVAVILSTRMFLSLAAGIFLLSMISALLYRFFGATLSRLVYAAERFYLIRARKTIAAIGAALLTSTVAGSDSFRWISQLVGWLSQIKGS